MFYQKSTMALFVGDLYLDVFSVKSITWKSERVAEVILAIPYHNRHFMDYIKDGITFDVVSVCFGTQRRVRDEETHTLLLSMIDIYDIEKSIYDLVINSPDDDGVLDIEIYFKCSIKTYPEKAGLIKAGLIQ